MNFDKNEFKISQQIYTAYSFWYLQKESLKFRIFTEDQQQDNAQKMIRTERVTLNSPVFGPKSF